MISHTCCGNCKFRGGGIFSPKNHGCIIFLCNYGYSDLFFVSITDIVILFLCTVNYRPVKKSLANSSYPKSSFDKK